MHMRIPLVVSTICLALGCQICQGRRSKLIFYHSFDKLQNDNQKQLATASSSVHASDVLQSATSKRLAQKQALLSFFLAHNPSAIRRTITQRLARSNSRAVGPVLSLTTPRIEQDNSLTSHSGTRPVSQVHTRKSFRGYWDNRLRENEAQHADEVAESEAKGYRSLTKLPKWTPPDVTAIRVPGSATGLGPVCPFALAPQDSDTTLPLIFATRDEVLTKAECQTIIDDARKHFAAGTAGSTFTLQDKNRELVVSEMPQTLAFLNNVGLPRVAALSGECFSEEAIGDPCRLRLYRAIVINYDAAAGPTHQDKHRDHSLLTCTITLNPNSEYRDGGTWFEALGKTYAPPRGHGLLSASSLMHAGHGITSGERWVLVLFLVGEKMQLGENVRHFSSRGQHALATGDRKLAYEMLTLARAMCHDADEQLRDFVADNFPEEEKRAAALGLDKL